jgi:hypothetical protein
MYCSWYSNIGGVTSATRSHVESVLTSAATVVGSRVVCFDWLLLPNQRHLANYFNSKVIAIFWLFELKNEKIKFCPHPPVNTPTRTVGAHLISISSLLYTLLRHIELDSWHAKLVQPSQYPSNPDHRSWWVHRFISVASLLQCFTITTPGALFQLALNPSSYPQPYGYYLSYPYHHPQSGSTDASLSYPYTSPPTYLYSPPNVTYSGGGDNSGGGENTSNMTTVSVRMKKRNKW